MKASRNTFFFALRQLIALGFAVTAFKMTKKHVFDSQLLFPEDAAGCLAAFAAYSGSLLLMAAGRSLFKIARTS